MRTRCRQLLTNRLTAKRTLGSVLLPHHWVLALTLIACGLASHAAPVFAQNPEAADTAAASTEKADTEEPKTQEPDTEGAEAEEKQTIPIPSTWTRLGRPGQSEVWLDLPNKSVIVGGHISLTRGGLEMFVCPVNTKEHESVIAAHAASFEVHTALLAVQAKPGQPVQWDPKYKTPTGSIIEVQVTWRDPTTGRLVTRWGKELVRDYYTGQGLGHDWIFGGSILERDPESGESYYYADSGPLLCVSNFTTATMDLNVPSSASDGELLYEAFTENLPAQGTKVYVRLTPGEVFEGE